MHIVSVVTLLLGSIFAYSLAAPQHGHGYYPVNIAGLSAALAQLAKQLAAQRNSTVEVGNNSAIITGVSSSNAHAHIDGRPGHNNNHHHSSNGWNNGWGNNGWGYWRGVPEKYSEEFDVAESGNDFQGGDSQDDTYIESKDEE